MASLAACTTNNPTTMPYNKTETTYNPKTGTTVSKTYRVTPGYIFDDKKLVSTSTKRRKK